MGKGGRGEGEIKECERTPLSAALPSPHLPAEECHDPALQVRALLLYAQGIEAPSLLTLQPRRTISDARLEVDGQGCHAGFPFFGCSCPSCETASASGGTLAPVTSSPLRLGSANLLAPPLSMPPSLWPRTCPSSSEAEVWFDSPLTWRLSLHNCSRLPTASSLSLPSPSSPVRLPPSAGGASGADTRASLQERARYSGQVTGRRAWSRGRA